MFVALRRVAVGLYVLWLVAVVLLMLGRYTLAPLLPGVHAGVVVGAAALTVVGAGKLLRDGYDRLAG
ncbi:MULTISPECIES: hypothetical protein [Halorussus]|uniref:hypothetical protein n=1 Tax=Halorussus TaxID=1070314 RepID=UPI000E214145|nr:MULTISPECIES: hypothetical protein [Halorussus]NHN59785.1 hypothetical protein [Halorussus sp. JP-T4]